MPRSVPHIALAVAVGVVGGAGGCATFHGARLYDEGTAALDRGDTATAISELEEAARLVPRASEIQNHLGLAYQQAGRKVDARAAFQRAVDLDCGNEAARANLRALTAQAVREAGP